MFLLSSCIANPVYHHRGGIQGSLGSHFMDLTTNLNKKVTLTQAAMSHQLVSWVTGAAEGA